MTRRRLATTQATRSSSTRSPVAAAFMGAHIACGGTRHSTVYAHSSQSRASCEMCGRPTNGSHTSIRPGSRHHGVQNAAARPPRGKALFRSVVSIGRGAARGRTYRMQQLRGSISVRSPMRARRRHCRGAEGAAIDSDGSGCAPVAPWRFQKRFGDGGLGRGGGLGGQLNRPIRRVTA